MHSERDVDAWDLLWEIPKEVLLDNRPVSSKPVVVRRVAPNITGQHLSAGESSNLSALHNKFATPHDNTCSNDAPTSERSLTIEPMPVCPSVSSPQSRTGSQTACATSVGHPALPSSHDGLIEYRSEHSIFTSPPDRRRGCSPQLPDPDAGKGSFMELTVNPMHVFGLAPHRTQSGSESCGGSDASMQPEAPAEPSAQAAWTSKALQEHCRGQNPLQLLHSDEPNTTATPATAGAPEGLAPSEVPALLPSTSLFDDPLALSAAVNHLPRSSSHAQKMERECLAAETDCVAAVASGGPGQLKFNPHVEVISSAGEALLPPSASPFSARLYNSCAQAGPEQAPCGAQQPLPPLRRAPATTTSRLLSELRRGRPGAMAGGESAGTITSLGRLKRPGGGFSGDVTGRADKYRSWTGESLIEDPDQFGNRKQNQHQKKLDNDHGMGGDDSTAAGAGAAGLSRGPTWPAWGFGSSAAAGSGQAAKVGFGQHRAACLLTLSPRRRFDFSTRRRKVGGGGDGAAAAVGMEAGAGGGPPLCGRSRARNTGKRRAPGSYVAVMEDEFEGADDDDLGEGLTPPPTHPARIPASTPPPTLPHLEDALAEWRQRTARSIRKAPEMLLRSVTLSDLAARCPTSVLCLEDVPGLARPWIRRYGQQVLDVCRNHVHLQELYADHKIAAATAAAKAEARQAAVAANTVCRKSNGSYDHSSGNSGCDREVDVGQEEAGSGEAGAEQGVASKRVKVTAGREQHGSEKHNHHHYHHCSQPPTTAQPLLMSSDGDSATTNHGGLVGVRSTSMTSPHQPQAPQPPTAVFPSRGASEGGGGSCSDGGSSSATSPALPIPPGATSPATHDQHHPPAPAAAAAKPKTSKSFQGGGAAAVSHPGSVEEPFSASATLQRAAAAGAAAVTDTHRVEQATGILGDRSIPRTGASAPPPSVKFQTTSPPYGNGKKPKAAAPATRRSRGRPKGSLNRPKTLASASAAVAGVATKSTPRSTAKSKAAAAAATAALAAAAAAAPANAWVPPPLGYCRVRRETQLAFATTPDVESIRVDELLGLLAEAGRAAAPFLETTGSVGASASGGRVAAIGSSEGGGPRDATAASGFGSGACSEGGGRAAAAKAGVAATAGAAELPSAALVAAAAVNRLGRVAGQPYLRQLRAMAGAALPAWEVRRVLACRAVSPDGGCMQAAAVLRVGPSCGREGVRVAFRRLSLLVHPDKNRSDAAADAFALVSSAASVLMGSRL